MAAKQPFRVRDDAGYAFRALTIWATANASDVGAAPIIFSGSGVPSGGTLPSGETLGASQPAAYFRTDGTVSTFIYVTVNGGTTWFPLTLDSQTIVAADGAAIPVTHSGSLAITQNGAETNTLADPTFIGQWLNIFVDTDTSGARVITAASRINQAANTIITLTEVGDFIKLEAITIAGALKWQVTSNEGAVLS